MPTSILQDHAESTKAELDDFAIAPQPKIAKLRMCGSPFQEVKGVDSVAHPHLECKPNLGVRTKKVHEINDCDSAIINIQIKIWINLVITLGFGVFVLPYEYLLCEWIRVFKCFGITT